MAKKVARKEPSPTKKAKPVELPLEPAKPKEEPAAPADAQSGMGSPNETANGDASGKPPPMSPLERAFDQILKGLEQEARDEKKSDEEKGDQNRKNRKAIAKSAKALAKALEDANKDGTQPKVHESAAVRRLIEPCTEYTSPLQAHPGHPLPLSQFPSTWQVAQLAAQISQGRPEMQFLLNTLPDHPTDLPSEANWQNGYTAGNSLTNAALMIWRSAHDMRQVWQTHTLLQNNYGAAKRLFFAPRAHHQQEIRDQITSILKHIAPQFKDITEFDEEIGKGWLEKDPKGEVYVNKDRFAEYWRDLDFVPFDQAAILFFRMGLRNETPASNKNPHRTPVSLFSDYLHEYLESTCPEKEQRDSFIRAWKKTDTQAEEEGESDQSFRKSGRFAQLWDGLILHFAQTLKRTKSHEMRERGKVKKAI